MKLNSLHEIFTGRIIRIPDYQRGYSWQKHQLEDFWEDLLRLETEKVHYTGVVTLEPVKEEIWKKWEEDRWFIDVGFKAFYIVDGQQRITTSIILIQAILESVPKDSMMNHQSFSEIVKHYILCKAPDGQRKSFLFGYEKDNPSYEFLKTAIFGIHSHSNLDQQTLYTHNLQAAKDYFKEKLSVIKPEEINILFKKLTQKLKFNLYAISDEVDVCVIFETMNNRGKPLTNLELLKNRLIYLSTLFKDHEGQEILRNKINDAWKTVYEYLGKNPEVPLDDDLFLRDHWIMYFKYTRNKGDDYIKFLLNEKFIDQNISRDNQCIDKKITAEEIEAYVTSLQTSIKPWFYIQNPHYPIHGYKNIANQILLEDLTRLSFGSFKPLIMAAYVSSQNMEDINKLLREAERYNFVLFHLSKMRSNTKDSELFGYARELFEGRTTIQEVIGKINEIIKNDYKPTDFLEHISKKYTSGRREGFYKWNGLKYFLFENEKHLQKISKQSDDNKLVWEKFFKPEEAKQKIVTVEHIFPQTAKDSYWHERYKNFDEGEKLRLTHSLGNLLPLSISKNSSLQNDPFKLKKDNGSGVGYYNGSISENEVNKNSDWDAKNILERGMNLLNFMEKRWDIDLGDDEFKKKLLHLEFVK